MKFLKSILCTFLIGVALSACAQNNKNLKTETIKVWGNCEMCKKRIDKAAAISGVTKANWDADKKTMKLTYDTTKTNTEAVEKAIAAVGYDTELVKADEKAYADLPECCQYERKKL